MIIKYNHNVFSFIPKKPPFPGPRHYLFYPFEGQWVLTMALIKSNDGPLPAPTALGSSAVPVRQRGGRAGLGGML